MRFRWTAPLLLQPPNDKPCATGQSSTTLVFYSNPDQLGQLTQNRLIYTGNSIPAIVERAIYPGTFLDFLRVELICRSLPPLENHFSDRICASTVPSRATVSTRKNVVMYLEATPDDIIEAVGDKSSSQASITLLAEYHHSTTAEQRTKENIYGGAPEKSILNKTSYPQHTVLSWCARPDSDGS